VVLNRQEQVSISVTRVRAFVGKLHRALRLGRRDFNVCFVNDREIRRLNTVFRGNPQPTDVLAFPWRESERRVVPLRDDSTEARRAPVSGKRRLPGENWILFQDIKPGPGKPSLLQEEPDGSIFEEDGLNGFLWDFVISAQTERRNARAEGHSTPAELRWLILHGLLHLLGYDHETDNGQMTRLEHSLRTKLSP
jgi:probable rRNA maturation factor